MVYIRPLDLSMDETLYAIQSAVERVGARRCRARFHLGSRSGARAGVQGRFSGITILLTVEVTEPYNQMRFTPHTISFLTHDIVLQRYMEVEGQLRSFLTIIKSRARAHSRDLRAYEVTSKGIVVGERLAQYTGVISATPRLRENVGDGVRSGMTAREALVAVAFSGDSDLSLDALEQRTAMHRDHLERALERLLAMGRVKMTEAGGERRYTLVTPPPSLAS